MLVATCPQQRGDFEEALVALPISPPVSPMHPAAGIASPTQLPKRSARGGGAPSRTQPTAARSAYAAVLTARDPADRAIGELGEQAPGKLQAPASRIRAAQNDSGSMLACQSLDVPIGSGLMGLARLKTARCEPRH